MAKLYELSKKEETLSKRFTDTEKWSHKWYRILKPKYKCAWQYVLDCCDFAGVWIVDFDAMGFYVGEEITEEEFSEIFKEKVTKVSSDKYFINGFPVFQYANREGKLSLNNSVVVNALDVLKKFEIDLSEDIAPPGGHPRPGAGVKEEDKEKDMDKEKVKEKEKEKKGSASNPNTTPGDKKAGNKSAFAIATSIWVAFSKCGQHELLNTRERLSETEKEILEKFGSASQIMNCPGSEVTSMKIKLQEAAKEVLNSS